VPAILSASARRYAEAAFAVAREDGDYDRWLGALEVIRGELEAPVARAALLSPAVPAEQKWAALDQVLAGQPPPVRNLLHILAERDRLDEFDQIVQAFRELVNQERGVLTAEVTTVVPLDAELQRTIAARLGSYLRHDPARLAIETRVDPSIIGGVVARVGDTVIDDSVRGRIARLRRALTAAQ
jgi:F-type H+-transporting ATPase subunit delta